MDPFKKKDPQVEADELKDIIRDTLNKKKKPVKFTWKGAADLLISMSNTPLRNYQVSTLMDKSLPRITDLAEGRSKPKEKDYIDFFEDMEKSIFGAAQNIAYSFGDLITTGIDMAADTNLTQKLDKVYEETKIDDPETLLGSVNKVLIEFDDFGARQARGPSGQFSDLPDRVLETSRHNGPWRESKTKRSSTTTRRR